MKQLLVFNDTVCFVDRNGLTAVYGDNLFTLISFIFLFSFENKFLLVGLCRDFLVVCVAVVLRSESFFLLLLFCFSYQMQ